MSPEFDFIKTHEVRKTPDYNFQIDEYRRPDGTQALLAHICVYQFAPSVMKTILRDWALFRECVPAPLFALNWNEDAKWVRFIERLGFRRVCEASHDGEPHQIFLHTTEANHVERSNADGHFKQRPVEETAAVPNARV